MNEEQKAHDVADGVNARGHEPMQKVDNDGWLIAPPPINIQP